jgi:ribonuclease HI
MNGFIRKMYCDGGMIGTRNPSTEGVHWSVGWDDGHGFHIRRGRSTDYSTNNEAEWLALTDAIRLCSGVPFPVVIHSDSEVIVRQFNGIYRCKNPRLQPLMAEALELAREVPDLQVVWVPRAEIVPRLGH